MKSRLVVMVLFGAVAHAGAPVTVPPVAEARGDLDGDGRPERAHLEADNSLRVDDSNGHELGRVMLPASAGGRLSIVPVEDRPLLHARVPLKNGRASEAVVRVEGGAVETLWLGPTGPVGDGERADRLRVDEAGLIRYQTAPTVSRCDGADMLFPERWDFAGKRFRPVDDEVPDGKNLPTVRVAPADLLPQPLGLFHFTAASTSPDADRHADRLGAPRELEDGRVDTLWVAGSAQGGRGAWVTARAPSEDHRLRALRITPGPGAPKELVLLAGGERFKFSLAGREPAWVILPEPLATGCVSLVVKEPHGVGADTSLAEVALFTDVDVTGGIDELVTQVATGQSRQAASAEMVLAGRGVEAARAIAAWLASGAQATGRRRLLSVLAQLRVPEAAPALGRALETANGDERSVIVAGLVQLGAAGAVEGARVYRDRAQAPEARADAAQILGAVGGESEIEALVENAGDGEPSVRLATLRALEASKRPEPVARALLASTACDARVGILSRALGRLGQTSAKEALTAVWRRCAKSGDFAFKLRLVRGAGESGASEILAEAAVDSDATLRRAAVEAGGPAEHALDDLDPGVRRAGLSTLDVKVVAPVEKLLGQDRWPLVRRAAADALGRRCGNLPQDNSGRGNLSQALPNALWHDGAEEVRRESLMSLGRCHAAPLNLVGQVLASHDQPISVRELAAALIGKESEKKSEAAHHLADAVDDVLTDPSADERSASLAIACLRALGRLHVSERRVLEALGAASNEPLSPAVRAAAVDTIGELCPDGAADVFHRASADPEPGVRRSAKQALDKCRR